MNSGNAARILGVSALLAAILFTLGGCMSTRIIEKPVYIDTPVTEPCIERIPEEPDYETRHLQPDDPIGVVGQAYRIERQQRESYISILKAEMAGCVDPGGSNSSYGPAERNR